MKTNLIKRTLVGISIATGSLILSGNALGATPPQNFEMRCQLSQQSNGSGDGYKLLADEKIQVNLRSDQPFEPVFFLRIEGSPNVRVARDMIKLTQDLPADLISRKFELSAIQAGQMGATEGDSSHGLVLSRFRGVLKGIGSGAFTRAMLDTDNLMSSSNTVTMLSATLEGPVFSIQGGAKINGQDAGSEIDNSALGCLVL